MNTYKQFVVTGMFLIAMGTTASYGAALVGGNPLNQKMFDYWHNNAAIAHISRSKATDILDTIKQFRLSGADIGYTDSNGNNLLHYAMQGSNQELARRLLSWLEFETMRPLLSAVNKQGHTPVTLAITTFKTKIYYSMVCDFCALESAIASPIIIDKIRYTGIRHFIHQYPLLTDEERTELESIFNDNVSFQASPGFDVSTTEEELKAEAAQLSASSVDQ